MSRVFNFASSLALAFCLLAPTARAEPGACHVDGAVRSPGGDLLRADGNVVHHVDCAGVVVGVRVASRPGLRIGGMIMGLDGELLVASVDTHSILRFDANTGAFRGVLVPSRRGGLRQPDGLVLAGDGSLYVTCHSCNSLLRFDGRTGVFLPVAAPVGALAAR